MEMLFHKATQPISGDILHQWQTIATVGQSAGMSACLANTSVHTAETKAKNQGSFFSQKCPVVCANLENLCLQRASLDFDLDLSPSWQRINNKKGLARESSKVRTHTRSIRGAYCEIRGLCGHIKPSNLRGEIMCAEFISDPHVSRWRNVPPVKKEKNKWAVAIQHQTSYFHGLPLVIRSTTWNKWCDLHWAIDFYEQKKKGLL